MPDLARSDFTPRTDWVDLPSHATPIRAADLLRLEQGIATAAAAADINNPATTTGAALKAALEAKVSRTGAAAGQIPVLQADSTLALRDLATLVDSTAVTPADLGLVAASGVRAVSTAGQSVGNGAYPVYLDLTATDFNDDGNLYAVDTTNNKITVSASGLYVANWGAGFTPTANTTQETYLTKNGGNALTAAAAGNTGQANGTFLLRLLANDYVQLICYVEGAAITLSTAGYRNWLSLHRIGL